jgi:hypothetical protein
LLTISCIVEGHGDVDSLPLLIDRVIYDVDPSFSYRIMRPCLRLHRSKFNDNLEYRKMVELAVRKAGMGGATIILLDADDDCPAVKGAELKQRAESIRSDGNFKVILAKSEFESWFLASASSLAGYRGLPENLLVPANAEDIRDAKGWLSGRMSGNRYSPTVDQPPFTNKFDINLARTNSGSFNKFYRDVSSLLRPNY